MTVDIIGAGIGGLTTAIALGQQGIGSRIYEQAPEIKPVGAGIILANNAMQVYERLGLREIIEQHGNPISAMKITKSNLSPISHLDLTYFEEKHGVKNIAIHRGTLQQILLDHLPSTPLHLGHRLQDVQATDTGYHLMFDNKESADANILIGADGIHSTVRQQLFSHCDTRQAKQICWRGVAEADLPERYQHELTEAWGKADRFGFVQIAPGRVYWYALKSFKQSREELSLDELDSYFQSYDAVVQKLIASTSRQHIHTAEISDLAPTHDWSTHRACLIGDAAHATTPNMGQGACQAIEDAFTLAVSLKKHDVPLAFQAFQKLRLPKAHKVVNRSWQLGKIAHLSNPLLIGLRNMAMNMTPDFALRKQSAYLFRLGL